MKKPIINLRNKETIFGLITSLAVSIILFWILYIGEDSVTVFAGGTQINGKGIFNIVNGWVG